VLLFVGKIIEKMNGLCWVSIGEKVRKLAIYWVRIFEVPDQFWRSFKSKIPCPSFQIQSIKKKAHHVLSTICKAKPESEKCSIFHQMNLLFNHFEKLSHVTLQG
jgi:hypothetical protein